MPDDLAKRLAYWANQLSLNKQYPWVGPGLISDLKQAATILGAEPDKMFPAEWPKAEEMVKVLVGKFVPTQEFDL